MTNRSAKESKAPPKKGRGQIWVALLCIGLSNILSVLWIWSLIGS